MPGTEKGIQSLPEKYRAEAQALALKYQELQKLAAADRKLYLDIEDKLPISVFSKPGIFTTATCEADAEKHAKKNKDQACSALGWPDNKANITSTGNIDFRIEKDKQGNDILRTYSEVEFAYEREGRNQKGKGWIAQDFVSFEPVDPSYSDVLVQKTAALKGWAKEKWEDICSLLPKKEEVPQTFPPAAQSNLKAIADLSKATNKYIDQKNQERRTVSSVAEGLSSSIGQCLLKPPNVAPTDFVGNLVFDQYVLPSLKKMKIPKDIRKEDGTLMTQKDLIEVDAMARTLYAEMASCVDLGSQYQMAVARVIRNRAQAVEKDPILKRDYITFQSEHSSSKSLMTQIATSPVQFSAWNQEIIDFKKLENARAGEIKAQMRKGISREVAAKSARKIFRSTDRDNYKHNESGLLHTLCPPSDPKGLCYSGRVPIPSENVAWESSLKVAVETVLFPKQFAAKTAELEGINNYTSGRDRYEDYIEVKPTIDGRKVDSKACLNLWRPMTAEEKKAKVEEQKRKWEEAKKKKKPKEKNTTASKSKKKK